MRKLCRKWYKKMFGKPYYKEVLDMYVREDEPNISYVDLLAIPEGKVLDVYPNVTQSVTGQRLEAKGNRLVFRVEMKKGAVLLCHSHPDCDEIVLVMSGKIINLVDKNVTKALRMTQFKKHEQHCIKALEDSILYIEFKPILI